MIRLLCMLLILLGSLTAQTSFSREHAPAQPNLEPVLETIIAEYNLPGAVVAYARGGEGDIQVAAAGYADLGTGQPVTPDTQFFIGSISKNLYATVALHLAQDGLLDLDAPVSNCTDWADGDRITVRMLLNHTSGIPDYIGMIFRSPEDVTRQWFAQKRTQPELLAVMDRFRLLFEPGTEQAYSNTNALLLGEVLVSAGGMSMAQLLDKHICQPLGLENTYLYGVEHPTAPDARGYREIGIWNDPAHGNLVDATHADLAFLDTADGSIVSTAADLVRYHQGLRGGRLIDSEHFELMRTIDPGIDNGLSYIIGEAQFGKFEGNLGRMTCYIAASIYLPEYDLYFAFLANNGTAGMPIKPLIEEIVGSRP